VTVLDESTSLHRRVRAFVDGVPAPGDDFDRLALDIAQFQRRYSPRFARLVEARSALLESVDSIPAVPADAFRLARVAVHAPDLDQARFLTSGTTAAPGMHPFRTTDTYRHVALLAGEAALTAPWPGSRVVVALAAPDPAPPTSSLAFMMQAFVEAWDGRALVRDPLGATFDPRDPLRWLASSAGVDVAGLRRAALLANERQEPLVVLATAFALVNLLDALGGSKVPAPRRTVVMVTGGYKGRTRELSPRRLRSAVAAAFRIPREQVVGEYGMTELSSQLYEGTLPGATRPGPPGLFLPPPWLAVTAVDPISLRRLPEGAAGLARFVDLGNVDSAVAVLTEDLVRTRDGGVELLGRRRGAAARGCSLAFESLVVAGAGGRQ
jgi:hypothetical protein